MFLKTYELLFVEFSLKYFWTTVDSILMNFRKQKHREGRTNGLDPLLYVKLW